MIPKERKLRPNKPIERPDAIVLRTPAPLIGALGFTMNRLSPRFTLIEIAVTAAAVLVLGSLILKLIYGN